MADVLSDARAPRAPVLFYAKEIGHRRPPGYPRPVERASVVQWSNERQLLDLGAREAEIDMTLPRLRLAEHNGVSLDAYRFETLDPLHEMAARVSLLEVA